MMKRSESNDLLAKNQLSDDNSYIPSGEFTNIERVISVINNLPQTIYTCDLLVNLLQSYPIILIKNTDMCKGLLGMYMSFVNSNDYKISANTFSFIPSWSQTLKQYCKDKYTNIFSNKIYRFRK